MLQAPVNDKKTKPEASRSERERESERLVGLTGWGVRSALGVMSQAYGNQAALRMLRSHRQKSPTFTPVQGGILQRKCACGNTASVSGVCTECLTNQEVSLQRKAEGGSVQEEVPQIVYEVLRSPGQPLDRETRTFMESQFDHDFRHVRVHTDARAAESAKAVNASAYTVKQDIVFGDGQYTPHVDTGKQLLAHELAHVIQQRSSGTTTGNIYIGDSNDPSEKQADESASAILFEGRKPSKLEDISTHKNSTAVNLSAQSHLSSDKAILRRQSLRERASRLVRRIERAVDPQTRQFFSDMFSSITESPQHVGEFVTDELLVSIRENWPSIIGVTLGILAAELVIGALAAAPTGVTQIIAAILEVIVLALLGYFAAVELGNVIEQGIIWWNTVREANGDPRKISDASRAFVRMVWHIFMVVLAVAGVRARIRRGATSRIAAPFRSSPPPSPSPRLQLIQGGNPEPVIIRDGRVVSESGIRGRATTSTSSEPTASAFGRGGTARQLAPAEQPISPQPVPVEPVPTPTPTAGARGAGTSPRPGVQPLPALAAGASSGTPDRSAACQIRPIPPLGNDPLSALYCSAVTGGNRSYEITLNPSGTPIRRDRIGRPISHRWAEIDTLRGNTWFECKCGYEALLRGERGEGRARSVLSSLDSQVLNHVDIARSCGLEYRFIVSNDYVADILRRRWFGNVVIDVRPFEPCD